MKENKVIKIRKKSVLKKISVRDIPVEELRLARSALAEDIVIAEIAIADDFFQSGKDVAGKLARLRGEINSLEKIDTFLKEIES